MTPKWSIMTLKHFTRAIDGNAKVSIWPVWTACRALYWRGLTAWSSLPGYRPTCCLRLPCPGSTCTHRYMHGTSGGCVEQQWTPKGSRYACFSFLTPPHPPQAPGRSPSPSGFWWSSDRWQWAGRWVGRKGSDPAASGSTTWPTETNKLNHRTWHISSMHYALFMARTMACLPWCPPHSGSPSGPSTCHSGTWT